MKFTMNRREFIAAGAISPLATTVALGGCAKAEANRKIMTHHKSIPTNTILGSYALNWHSTAVAIANIEGIELFNMLSGSFIETKRPLYPPRTLVQWGRNDDIIAVGSGNKIALLSGSDLKFIKQIDYRQPGSGLGDCGLFSQHTPMLYVNNSDGQLDNPIIKVDVETEDVSSILNKSQYSSGYNPYLSRPRFQSLQNYDVCNFIVSETPETSMDLKNLELGPSYNLSLKVSGELAYKSIQFVLDTERGIDESGIMRQSVSECLISEPTGLLVVFRKSGTPLNGVPIDISKEKSFETYDVNGRRVSAFGGYGTPEGNYIGGFDVHPLEPWVVTTSSRAVSKSGGFAGMVTLWHLPTGQPIQRIETSLGVMSPRISQDGKVLTTILDRGLELFHFD